MNIALILAGGIGRRIDSAIPKQFLTVNSVPVIVYTMRIFQDSNRIDAICVVAHSEWINTVWDYKMAYGLDKIRWVVPGGHTGLESVKNGINALEGQNESDLILIHDSVRPFLTQKAIDDNIRVAEKFGVALTSVPCVETLVRVDDAGMAKEQIPRDGLMRVMTPQTFRLDILIDLFSDVDIVNSPFPSTFSLYMSKGFPVHCSLGSERNIKITYPEDIMCFTELFPKF